MTEHYDHDQNEATIEAAAPKQKKGKASAVTASTPTADELKSLLIKKLEDFKSKRGHRVWQHRRISTAYIIPEKFRYEVPKRINFRCFY